MEHKHTQAEIYVKPAQISNALPAKQHMHMLMEKNKHVVITCPSKRLPVNKQMVGNCITNYVFQRNT